MKVTNVAPNLEAMFKFAENFNKACQAMNIVFNETGDWDLIVPNMVNSAFSLEIYFKCLVGIERGKIPHGHDLKSLYDKLSSTSKSQIKATFAELIERSPVIQEMKSDFPYINLDLDHVLSQARNAFVSYRYAYEGIPQGGGFYGIYEVKKSARKRILELKPEWDRRIVTPTLYTRRKIENPFE